MPCASRIRSDLSSLALPRSLPSSSSVPTRPSHEASSVPRSVGRGEEVIMPFNLPASNPALRFPLPLPPPPSSPPTATETSSHPPYFRKRSQWTERRTECRSPSRASGSSPPPSTVTVTVTHPPRIELASRKRAHTQSYVRPQRPL